jgi:hypothetical protein
MYLGWNIPGDLDRAACVYVPRCKEKSRSWHIGPDYMIQVCKEDWRLKRYVYIVQRNSVRVPVLLELVSHDGTERRRQNQCLQVSTVARCFEHSFTRTLPWQAVAASGSLHQRVQRRH